MLSANKIVSVFIVVVVPPTVKLPGITIVEAAPPIVKLFAPIEAPRFLSPAAKSKLVKPANDVDVAPKAIVVDPIVIVELANLILAIPPLDIAKANVPELVIGEPVTVIPSAPVAVTDVTVPTVVL